MERISAYKNLGYHLRIIATSAKDTWTFQTHAIFKALIASIFVFLVLLTLGWISQNNGWNRSDGPRKFDVLDFLGSIAVFLCGMAVMYLGVNAI